MKKSLVLFILVCSGILTVSAQKNGNGSIYIEHPAIRVTAEFEKAIVSGDSAKIASFLTDSLKSYNGTTADLSLPFMDKKAFLGNVLRYSRELDYFAVEPVPGSYPDALEYTKDNKNGDIVVQNWLIIKGVQYRSGYACEQLQFRQYAIWSRLICQIVHGQGQGETGLGNQAKQHRLQWFTPYE